METPLRDLEGCRDAHQRLATVVGRLSDLDLRRPSLLPGWTVGHVLSHLARNAEAMVARVEGAVRGEQVEQYVGGAAGRAAEIELGASRSAAELGADVLTWSVRLETVFASLHGDDWVRPVRTVAGGGHPILELPFRRWREVEVHLIDLGSGYGPDDWSDAFVERLLPRLVGGLTARVDQRTLMAWLLGRGPAPDLPPWG